MGLFTATDKVKFKKLKEEGCEVTVSVEIPAAQVSDETHNVILAMQQRARLPGFRPGKAPLELVKKQFAGHAQEEVIDRMARKHVPEALRELQLRPVATPEVSDVSFAAGKPLQFQVRVEVAPKFAPKDYTKLAVARKAYPADEKTIDERVSELRESHARLDKAPEDAVAGAHYAVIDYRATQDGKPLSNAKGDNELVDMSSDQTVEGLTAGLLGMKRAEVKDIPVKLGGKPAVLAVTLKEIKTKILPPVDAEFAKDIGFDSVPALRAKLKEVIESEGKQRSERETVEQIEAAVLKANKFAVPASLVESQLEHMLQRLSRQLMGSGKWPQKQLDDLKAKLRPKAEDEVRMSLLLGAIAEKEKIAAAPEDVSAELDRALAAEENEEGKDKVRKLFAERKEEVEGMLRDRKTMAFLREKAVIKDAA